MADKDGVMSADDLFTKIVGAANPGDTGREDATGPVDDEQDEQQLNNEDPLDPADDPDAEQDEDDPEHDEDDPENDQDVDPEPEPQARNNRQQQQDNPGNKKPKNPFDLRHKPKQDRQGNVYIDDVLVAKAGREARMYHGFRAQAINDQKAATGMAQRIVQIANGARELVTRYDELKKQKSVLDTAGMTPADTALMLEVVTAYKKNPIDGLKLMLTKAHMAGVDIKSLGAAGSLDPTTLLADVKSHMSEMLKPVLEKTSREARVDDEVKEAQGFFQRNPEARDVAKVLGGSKNLGLALKEAKRHAPDLSLDELFGRLHYELLKRFNGQIPTGPVAERPRNDRQQQRRRPAGRNRNKSSDSYEDIAKDVLEMAARMESRGQ